jgi:hypothetical protein
MRFLAFALGAVTLTGSTVRLGAQAPVDSTLLRPTEVMVTISNDRGNDGTYRATAISRVCGKQDMMGMMPHRANSLHIEFPSDEPNLAVTSVTFDADTLPPGATTRSFLLNVGIRTPNGGQPPLYVLRPKEPQYGEPGTAVRTRRNGIDSLVVDGIATKGTKVGVRLIAVCGPRP